MLAEKRQQFGLILESICEELDISKSQYEDAKKKYKAVGEWMAEEDTLLFQYRPEIYPQGSMRLGTAVKPLDSDEFDVDLVCELQVSSSADQSEVKDIVGRRLAEHETYKKMRQEKNRCWRLDYAGQFHMDILPAIPDATKGNCCLLVPDSDLKEWSPSNPKGYADWFKNRMRVIRTAMLEAKANVEDMPDNDYLRTPLQRVVQILKRQRDIAFKNNKDNAPISIVITTLAAKAYNNEADLYDALQNIIQGMTDQVDMVDGLPCVFNPTNPEENFAEKWISNPERYFAFRKWLQGIQNELLPIIQMNNMPLIQESLAPLLGDSVVKKGMVRFAGKVDKQRSLGVLKMAPATGLLGSTGASVRQNTFYGD